MPRPSSEGLGRLSYRPGSRGSRLSLFHVKLTDAALHALLAHRRLQGAPRPVIAFRGSQGYLRIPRSPTGRPGPRSRLFSFYLSRCSKEKPQASFDCVRQSASRLESEGVIQERLTFCATEASACRLPEAHVEREPRRSSAPTATPNQEKGLSLPVKPGPGKTTRHAAAAAGGKGQASRELHARLGPFLAQLLALRPHQKAQLLEQTDQARLGLRARLQVLAALKEVGQQLDPQGRSCGQEEELLGQVQEDGPGSHTPPQEQQQRLALLLHRRTAHPALARPFPPSSHSGSLSRRSSRQGLRAALEPRAKRWQGPGFPGAESSWWGRKVAPVATQQRRQPCFSAGVPPGEPLSLEEEEEEGEAQAEGQGKELQSAPLLLSAVAGDSATHTAEAAEGGASRNNRADEHSCGSPQQEPPDYSLKYSRINSEQQCQAYKEDFSTDYAEYRHLHARIGSVSRRFAQLGARIRAMQQGTENYKVLENQILQEYRQFKKVHPNYQKEKQHCEYLHKKLSHIKELILHFEQNLPAEEAGGDSGGR